MHDAHSLARAFGFLYQEEVDLLTKLAHLYKPGAIGVIVGMGAGTSTLSILEGNDQMKLYSVDISKGGPLGGAQNETNALKDSKFVNRLDTWPIQIIGASHDIGHHWFSYCKEKIDFIFIDDGHLEEDIRGDIQAWRPNMRPGGIMAFHDYESEVWPAVYKVVNELMADCMFLDQARTTIAFILPDE